MKIKAAAIEKGKSPFVIKNDVELHDLEPTNLQVHMVISGICHFDDS